MNKLLLSTFLGFLGAGAVIGETVLLAPDDTRVVFEDWSAPAPLAVKATNGETQLIRRTCRATWQHPLSPSTLTIERLFNPASKELWLGQPQPPYAVVGGRIWGMVAEGADVWIRHSASVGEAANGEDLMAQEFLKKFVANPLTKYWMDGGIVRLDLERVFGATWPYPQSSGPPLDGVTGISQLAVDDRGLTLTLNTKAGHVRLLTLGPRFETRAAFFDGQAVTLLFEGLLPPSEPDGWAPARSHVVRTAAGKLIAMRSSRIYWSDRGTEQERWLTTASAVVLPSTGDLWLAPSDCRLTCIDGRLSGFMVEGYRDLLVFVGSQGRIPTSNGSIEAFRREIMRFESTFQANQYQWKPDLRVRLADLFKGDARFPDGCEFSMREVRVKDKNTLIVMSSGNSQAYPEITVAPDLSILSANVLDPAALPQINRD